jgi:integrase/recombinase XerD
MECIMRLSQAIDGFLLHTALGLSRHTVSDYSNTLRQWLAFLGDDPEVASVTADHVRRFLYYLRVDRDLAPKTVKNAHTGLSAFFTWLEAETGQQHVIRGRIASPKAGSREIVPLSRRDVRSLLDACDRSVIWHGEKRAGATTARATRLRDRAIIVCLLDTGMRAQELCSLLVGDVDIKTGAVQIRHGKGDKGRVVYLGVSAREALWRYLNKRKKPMTDDPLFATTQAGPMDRNALRKLLLAAGQRAEITESVGPHRFRHTFAINYLRNGGDVFTLQRLLGHSTMDMVRRYLALAEVDVADAHRRASPADNWRL